MINVLLNDCLFILILVYLLMMLLEGVNEIECIYRYKYIKICLYFILFMDIIGEGIVNILVIMYMVIFIKVFIDVIC